MRRMMHCVRRSDGGVVVARGPLGSRNLPAARNRGMNSPITPNPTTGLVPRSYEPQGAKAEDAPELTVAEPYKLEPVNDAAGTDVAPASAENEPNPLIDMVEERVIAPNDEVTRKVPDDHRSTVGTIAPAIT